MADPLKGPPFSQPLMFIFSLLDDIDGMFLNTFPFPAMVPLQPA